jgi:MFS transporter, PAT family, beta-lactamase induction signal transducer AmpG
LSAPSSTGLSIRAAFKSWRIGAITLLSLPSGLPMGFFLVSLSAWLTQGGVDIKTISAFTLVQIPYAYKFAWAPLMDRYRLPWLGRKRGWLLLWQVALGLIAFAIASQAKSLNIGVIAGLSFALAFASASQDIAIDAHAVESLEANEQGLAVGARVAMYRAAMWLSGYAAISLAKYVGWEPVLQGQAVIYLASTVVTVLTPEPVGAPAPPVSIREAVWLPFVQFLQRHRALEIAAFLVLFKVADNLAQSLVSPFLLKQGYDENTVGLATGTIGLVSMVVGTFIGGIVTAWLGVARALWIFGFLQAVSNLGYALVAQVGLNLPVLYGALAFEAITTGMGNGAFGVLLLRLTEKRFSATQYALFSSIFALGRALTGPIAGALVDALGWRDFFIVTVPCAIPGLLMLHRFAPFGSKEMNSVDGAVRVAPRPASSGQLVIAGVLAGIVAAVVGLVGSASLTALKALRGGGAFDLATPLSMLLQPRTAAQALELTGVLIFAAIIGCAAAAYRAAGAEAHVAEDT